MITDMTRNIMDDKNTTPVIKSDHIGDNNRKTHDNPIIPKAFNKMVVM